MTVTLDGKVIDVTAYEFSILRALAQRRAACCPRAAARPREGSAELSFDRSIDVHVSRLRAKLGDDSRSRRSEDVRGVGYLLAEATRDLAAAAPRLVFRVYVVPRCSRSP